KGPLCFLRYLLFRTLVAAIRAGYLSTCSTRIRHGSPHSTDRLRRGVCAGALLARGRAEHARDRDLPPAEGASRCRAGDRYARPSLAVRPAARLRGDRARTRPE